MLDLSLGLHELATNGVKYGALSNDEGHVEIEWTITDGSEPSLMFTWKERGGPEAKEPRRLGFGMRMIQRLMTSDFGAAIETRFPSQGFQLELNVSLAGIAA